MKTTFFYLLLFFMNTAFGQHVSTTLDKAGYPTSRCKYSKAVVMADSDPDCALCAADDKKAAEDRNKAQQDKAAKQNESEKTETSSSSSSSSSSGGNIAIGPMQTPYEKNMQDYRIAIAGGDYTAANMALKNANYYEPISNYEAISYSLNILGNNQTTGSALSYSDQLKLQTYSNLAAVGVQLVGDVATLIRENREARDREQAAEKLRLTNERFPVYYNDLAKSSARLMYEESDDLQQFLSWAVHLNMSGKFLKKEAFANEGRFFVPQEIKLKDARILTASNEVSIEKNGVREKITSQFETPNVILGKNRTKLVIYSYSNESNTDYASVMVYDLASKKVIWENQNLNIIGGNIMGLVNGDSVLLFSYKEEKGINWFLKTKGINIYTGKTTIDTRIEVGNNSKSMENGTRLLGDRFVLGEDSYYYYLFDMVSGRTAYLPLLYFNSLCAIENMILFTTGDVNGEKPVENYFGLVFEDLANTFTPQFQKEYGEQTDKVSKRLDQSKLVFGYLNEMGVYTVPQIQYNRLPEDKVIETISSHVYNVEGTTGGSYDIPYAKNKWMFGQQINSIVDISQPNWVDPSRTSVYVRREELFLQNSSLIIDLSGNRLSVKTLFFPDGRYSGNLKAPVDYDFALDFSPVAVISVTDFSITIVGVDQFAFPIIKNYDFSSLYKDGFVVR